MTLQSALSLTAQKNPEMFGRLFALLYPALRAEGKVVLKETRPYDGLPFFKIVREKEALFYTSPQLGKAPFWEIYEPR